MGKDKTIPPLSKTSVSDSFYWTTEYYHNDNSFTMNDYLDNHLPDNAKITFQDGSYAEIIINDQRYALDAKGNGDSYNHIVTLNVI
jgi:Na+-transporting NADH:ubiquinone oxidoreductase subunit NqrF